MPPQKVTNASGAGRLAGGWTAAVVVLVAVIIAGGVYIWSETGRDKGLKITFTPEPEVTGQISVSGAVNNPGIYPLKAGDTVNDVLQAAGGSTAVDGNTLLELRVPSGGEQDSPQKVDINRAEAWLLAALPGIGETRAQAIVDYRRQHGPFRDTRGLLAVPGIGDAIFAGIEDMVTVGE